MTTKKVSLIVSMGLMTMMAAAQTATAPPPVPKSTPQRAGAVPKAKSPVDAVIEMVKGGLSEAFIIKQLAKDNKPVDLTSADMVKLKQAGVSENIMNVMMDPSPATPLPPAPIVAPPPAPVPPPAPPAAAAAQEPSPAPPSSAQKKRVVVDPFGYSAVMTQVAAILGNTQNLGTGIQAMLVARLTQGGKVIVVDRSKIKEVTDEQDRNLGNRVKQGTGARTGRIIGADALLVGDIVIFGRDDKKKGMGTAVASTLGALCFMCKVASVAVSAKKEEKAVVAINYRLIDAETSEVIASGEARGESKRTSLDLSGAAGVAGMGGGAATVDMTSSNFGATIIGEATQNCVDKLADILNTQAVGMKKTFREVETSVVDVSGNTLMIGAGESDGVTVGEVFEIHHVLHEVKDPNTQEVLDRKTEKIGEMKITSVRPKVATGTYTAAGTYAGTPLAATKEFCAFKKMPPPK
jgi:curli biogenesis system outer membrane secretion channel CsgG